MSEATMTDLRERFADAAQWYFRPTSPLYDALGNAVAADPRLLRLLDPVADVPKLPQLFLAALHDLLLSGVDHPLRAFYPTCGPVGANGRSAGGRMADLLHDITTAHAATLYETVRTRGLQTNHPLRSAVLYLGMCEVAAALGGRPFGLVELGTSAGLLLRLDRYGYRFRTAAGTATGGHPEPGVVIPSRLHGARPDASTGSGPDPDAVSFPPLPVESRIGVDPDPLDLTDAGQLRWLRALIWADDEAGHRAFRPAVRAVLADPAPIVAATAAAGLPTALAAAGTAPACVFSSCLLAQVDPDEVSEIDAILRRASDHRPVFWLTFDGGTSAAGGALAEPGDPAELPLILTRYDRGTAGARLLGWAEINGHWIRWR